MWLSNLSGWQRGFRFLIGVGFLSWAVAGGPWWTYAGLYVLATAAWGYCPIKAFVTADSGSR